jgi:L,D-transpeptidase catalytic domain
MRPVFANASARAAEEPLPAPVPGSPGLLAGESPGVIEQALETPQPSFLTSITPLASATDAVESKPDAFPIAQVVEGAVELHSHPGGEVLAQIGATTEFGSPQTLSVTERRGDWLAVVTTELPNGQVGWIDLAAGGVELTSTPLRISIDLSRRELVLKRGDEILRRVPVGVGQAGSPTPIGRFAVTDELAGADYSAVYGCCIIALSAHQPNLPPGWEGGDRIAIHGTSDPASIGAATSAGCPHAADDDLRFLMREIPLGTPVVIHP